MNQSPFSPYSLKNVKQRYFLEPRLCKFKRIHFFLNLFFFLKLIQIYQIFVPKHIFTLWILKAVSYIVDKRLRITRRTLDANTKTNTLDLEVGTIVSFINKSSDWYWVEYDEKKGWIPVDSIEKLSDTAQGKRLFY